MMQAGGQTAVCDSCGMQYTVERMREKVQEIRGTVRVEGPVQARQTGTDDDVAQWRALVRKYYDAGDFQGAEQVVKKILEAVPGDEEANQLYDQLQVLKFMEVKNGVLVKYTGMAENVTIPGCVKRIGERVFYDCRSIKEVHIPESVTEIGECAFSGSGLNSVHIPDGVTSIGNSVFAYTGLNSVHIPDSVTSIGDSAFACTGLNSVHIPDGVINIGKSAFKNSSLESVHIPDSVTSIGEEAFDCQALKSVTIPERLISNEVFSDCYEDDDGRRSYHSKCPWYLKYGCFIEELRKVQRIQRERRAANVCQHCGGKFVTGFFGSVKCRKCGEPKDY